MKNNCKINYGDIIFSKRLELDNMAYSKYYDEHFIDDIDLDIIQVDAPLTFNQWYGSEQHKKYILPLLRKMKLEKIKKAN